MPMHLHFNATKISIIYFDVKTNILILKIKLLKKQSFESRKYKKVLSSQNTINFIDLSTK